MISFPVLVVRRSVFAHAYPNFLFLRLWVGHLESSVPTQNNEISSFYNWLPRPPLTCKVFPNVQRRLALFTLHVVTRGGACVTTWHASGWLSLFISIGNDVSRMKSRPTGKREVTRHVISCDLLLNDGSLSSAFNWLIVLKALIYFLTKVEIESYSETPSYFPTIKPNTLTR